jgi:hypothetical protein
MSEFGVIWLPGCRFRVMEAFFRPIEWVATERCYPVGMYVGSQPEPDSRAGVFRYDERFRHQAEETLDDLPGRHLRRTLAGTVAWFCHYELQD